MKLAIRLIMSCSEVGIWNLRAMVHSSLLQRWNAYQRIGESFVPSARTKYGSTFLLLRFHKKEGKSGEPSEEVTMTQ